MPRVAELVEFAIGSIAAGDVVAHCCGLGSELRGKVGVGGAGQAPDLVPGKSPTAEWCRCCRVSK